MKVLLFGATGMVGQGVLRECLLDPGVERVVSVGRRSTGVRNDKLRDVVVTDVSDLTAIDADVPSLDACFFCLGVSSIGMSEQDYERLTYQLTMTIAETLAKKNTQLTFVYVSGAGTDSSEHGRVRWARVKGRTENALLRLPFKAAYMFRPGAIQPLHGVRSKTAAYQAIYTVTAPLLPLLRRLFPDHILTTEELGRAMIAVVRGGAPVRVLESRAISALGRG